MRRNFMRLVGASLLAGVIIVVSALIPLRAPVNAGELECIDIFGGSPRKMRPPPAKEIIWPYATYPEERVFEGNEPCDKARFSGRVVEGDFDKFLRLLKTELLVTSVRLNSPGGSVTEAMKIGRLLRMRFVSAEANDRSFPGGLRGEKRQTCGGRNQSVCCASACALIYLGAAQWLAWDWVGLHRPTSQELGKHEYSEARELLRETEAELRRYFQEMEIDERIFLAMMSAPPSKIASVSIDESFSHDGLPYRYPPSIHDWLLAKCGKQNKRKVDDCMVDEFHDEQFSREQIIADPEYYYSHQVDKISRIEDLEKYIIRNAGSPIATKLATARLVRLRDRDKAVAAVQSKSYHLQHLVVERSSLNAGISFKDCNLCPELLVIGDGSFLMGPRENDTTASNAGPAKRIVISQPLAVGKFEVTFDEWDACVANGGCNAYFPEGSSENGWRRGQLPVVNVSWHDAKAYVAWLSKETGKPYILLSDSEWEYVARAGTTTSYWWGDSTKKSPDEQIKELAAQLVRSIERPLNRSVADGKPNPWGLYGIHDGVAEWVEDGTERMAIVRDSGALPKVFEKRNVGKKEKSETIGFRVLRGI